MTLRDELQKIIKGEVVDDEKTLEEYSRGYSIFEVKPRVIVFPRDEEDVKKLVTFVRKHPAKKLSITARSAGTDMSGGCLGESIILDFSRHMNKLKELGNELVRGEVKGYAQVQPGMYYRDFERAALKKNLFLRRDPRSKERKKYGQKGARKRFQYSKR